VDGGVVDPRMNDENIKRLEEELDDLKPDADAFYSKVLTLDLSTVAPYVSGPGNVKDMTSVYDIGKQNIKVDKAYLVSCVNSRVDDIAEAADVVKGKKVADGVEFYIAASSDEVQNKSEENGDWQVLLGAGAIPLPPGCGPCIGLGAGLLKDDEVGISATNRNFKGRMGSPFAKAYLASPYVVASSAISGKIDYDWKGDVTEISGSIKIIEKPSGVKNEVSIMEGFPEILTGDIVFCHQDNLNTDGIYPGKYTYIDEFTPEDQAGVVMENYDPKFKEMIKEGDILVGGYNFGTGSSREQAATALKYKGIQLVIAGSFSATYMRNALNNGYLVIELPKLVDDLKSKFGSENLTVLTGIKAKIDFKNSEIVANDTTYKFSPVGTAAQELIITGGLENWVKKNL
jgi:homoaconitate hydratase